MTENNQYAERIYDAGNLEASDPDKGETRRMLCGNLGEVEEEAPPKSIQKNIDICSSSSATEQSLAQGPPNVGLDYQIYTTRYNNSAVEISCQTTTAPTGKKITTQSSGIKVWSELYNTVALLTSRAHLVGTIQQLKMSEGCRPAERH